MFFYKNLFAALLAVAAVSVNGSPIELEKRAETVTLCSTPWDAVKPEQCPQGGQCLVQKCFPAYWTDGACVPDIGDFDGTISIVQTGPHVGCTLFSERRCTGAQYPVQRDDDGWVTLTGHWDKLVSSLRCYRRDQEIGPERNQGFAPDRRDQEIGPEGNQEIGPEGNQEIGLERNQGFAPDRRGQ